MQSVLDRAEALMEEHPDSALALLRPYDGKPIKAEEQRARFALLYSMALDKNYIDTVNFDVLQPALDYYPTHGTDADKLRTLYYAGVIFENASNRDEAMQCYSQAINFGQNSSDSLTLARAYVARGEIFSKLYRMDRYLEDNKQAEKLYRAKGDEFLADKALLRVFKGYIFQNRDSALSYKIKVSHLLTDTTSILGEMARSFSLFYEVRHCSEDSIRNFLEKNSQYGIDGADAAEAYLKIGNTELASEAFAHQETEASPRSRLKYLYWGSEVKGSSHQYEEAYKMLKDYTILFDSVLTPALQKDTHLISERVNWETKALKEQHSHEKRLWIACCAILIMLLIAIILYLRLKASRTQRALIEEKNRLLNAENINRQLETERLNSQLLEMEEERDTLEGIINNYSENTIISKALADRFTTINSLLPLFANKNNEKLADAIDSLMADRKKFLQDTRLGLTISNPKFISYLEEHGLSDVEIEYMCLCAIGFSGKEAGGLLNRKAHYNLGANIRKKLGLQTGSPHLSGIIGKLLKMD